MKLTDEQAQRLREAARQMPPADDFDHGMEMLARMAQWAAAVVACSALIAWWLTR